MGTPAAAPDPQLLAYQRRASRRPFLGAVLVLIAIAVGCGIYLFLSDLLLAVLFAAVLPIAGLLFKHPREFLLCALLLFLATLSRTASTFTVAGIPLAIAVACFAAFMYRREMRTALRESLTLRWGFAIAIVWTIWAGIRLAADYPIYGSLAVRDAIVAVQFLALPLGAAIAVAYSYSAIASVSRWVLGVVATYLVFYPFRGLFSSEVANVVNFSNIGVAGVSLLAYALWGQGYIWLRVYLAASGALAIVVSQGRMIYLVTAALLVLYVVRAQRISLLARIALLVLVLVLGYFVVGVISSIPGVSGRFDDVSVAGISDQLGSLGEGGSVADRQVWWDGIWNRLTSSPDSLLLGIGVGPDLLNGYVGPDGVLVRKPHNDYLEALARFGILGGVSIVALVLLPMPALARRVTGSGLSAALFAWCAGAAATAFAQPYFSYPHGVLMFAMVAGLGIGLDRIATSDASVGSGRQRE